MKSFTHAGVSKQDGEFKVRFANGAERIKILIKTGHTDIDLVELKYPSSKEDAVRFLMSIDFANGNAIVQAALDAAVDKRITKPAKVQAKKGPSMDAIKAKASAKITADTKAEKLAALASLDDAPY